MVDWATLRQVAGLAADMFVKFPALVLAGHLQRLRRWL